MHGYAWVKNAKKTHVEVEILGEAVQRRDERLGRDHPAEAPPRHGVVFGEGVDDDDLVGIRHRWCDLVGLVGW